MTLNGGHNLQHFKNIHYGLYTDAKFHTLFPDSTLLYSSIRMYNN